MAKEEWKAVAAAPAEMQQVPWVVTWEVEASEAPWE